MVTKPKVITKYAQKKYNLTYIANRKNNGTVDYIVVHYTGTSACAKNNCIFFANGNRNASADFFIDKDGTIYQFNASLNMYYSWHCGDGYGRYGINNYNSIGIEVVSAGAKFTKDQQEALRKLVTWLQSVYNVPDSKVVRHYDASRKLCPKPYCGTTKKNNLWKTLRKYITNAKASNGLPYRVRIISKTLKIRTNAGVSYKAVGEVKKGDVYTIVAEKKGVTVKWGKLKSGDGWISLGKKYVEKV